MKNNNNFYENVFSFSNGKIKKEDINKAKNGDLSSVLSSLSKEDEKKVLEALNDKEKAKQILSSDAAKSLLNKLFGDNK